MLDGEPEKKPDRDPGPRCIACHMVEGAKRCKIEDKVSMKPDVVVVSMLAMILRTPGFDMLLVINGMMHSLCPDHINLFNEAVETHRASFEGEK